MKPLVIDVLIVDDGRTCWVLEGARVDGHIAGLGTCD